MIPSPFVGEACPVCGERKVRLVPHADQLAWCHGCGTRRTVSAGEAETIARGAEATIRRLRDLPADRARMRRGW